MNDDFIEQADEYQIRLAEIRQRERRERRQWWGAAAGWDAALVLAMTFILAVAAAIINSMRGNGEAEHACAENGGSMVTLNQEATCLRIVIEPQ